MSHSRLVIPVVWLIMVAATLFSWQVTEQYDNAMLATVAVLLIATVKIQLIISHFMELKWQHRPWGQVLILWVIVVSVLIIGGFMYTENFS